MTSSVRGRGQILTGSGRSSLRTARARPSILGLDRWRAEAGQVFESNPRMDGLMAPHMNMTPRHVEAVLKEMGMENCKPVSNPWCEVG